MLPAVRTLTETKVISRKSSSRTLSNTQTVPKPKKEEYRSPTLAEIEKLSGAVTNVFQSEGSKPLKKILEETEETETQTWSCDSSYGMITPPLPAVSPMPEDSPELMSTEVFPLPVTSNPGNSDEDADTISRQWADLGVKDRTGRSDIYD
jgi:hypothetical protein